MIGQLGSEFPPVMIIHSLNMLHIYILNYLINISYSPAQGRARVVGVVVAGRGLLKVAVSTLRRSTSNSVSFLHNSSLSFSLFFSLILQNISIHNVKATDVFYLVVFQKEESCNSYLTVFIKWNRNLLLPFRLIAGSKFVEELAIHFHKCF